MMTFAVRRFTLLATLVTLSVAIALLDSAYAASLRRTSFFTGWTLFVMMLSLTLLNARKKLPFLPLGSASGWLQFHIYLGLLTIVVLFGFHYPS